MIAFQIIDGPTQYPGVTIGNQSDGPVVDTHYELGECHIYLHRRDIREAAATGILTAEDFAAVAATYGGLTAQESEALEQRVTDAEKRALDAETELAEWQPLIARVTKETEKYEHEAV